MLLLIAGALALLCTGGVGIAFLAYRDAAEPDRSSPDVAVDNYLRSYFVERNDAQASSYVCDNAKVDAAGALRGEMEQREADFDVQVRVSWGSLARFPEADGHEIVETELTIASSSQGQPRSRRTETWLFDVVDRNGWRVCEARKK